MTKKEVTTVKRNDVLTVKKTGEKFQVEAVKEEGGLYIVEGYLENKSKASFDSKEVTVPTGEAPFMIEQPSGVKESKVKTVKEATVPRKVALARKIVSKVEAAPLTQEEYDKMSDVSKRYVEKANSVVTGTPGKFVLKTVGEDVKYVISDVRVKNLTTAKRVFNNYFTE